MDSTFDVFLSTITEQFEIYIGYGVKGMLAIIGIALLIFSLKFTISTIKDFFQRITGTGDYFGEYEDYYGRDESDPPGWTEEDERAYRSGYDF